MFKEKYVRDNELIKPDDAFLERLKESVKQEEEEEVHIGEYIDLSNVKRFEDIERDGNFSDDAGQKSGKITWKNMVAIAACFVFVCTFAFVVGKTNILENNKVLQAGMESIFDKKDERDASQAVTSEAEMPDASCQEQFDKAYQLFLNANVVIYEVDGLPEEVNGISYLQEVKEAQPELEASERDELIGDIIARKYVLVDSMEAFEDAMYYVAVFEYDSYVLFAIDSQQHIYIEKVSGIQSLAWNK